MLRVCILIASSIVICAAVSSAFAQPADDTKMAREALAPYIPSAKETASARQSRIDRIHERIHDVARQMPNSIVSATLVLDTGFSIQELDRLSRKFEVQVVALHLKTPYNDKGAIQSIDIGAVDLAKYRGNFEARAERAVGAMRYKFLDWSRQLPEKDAKHHYSVAHSLLNIYRCEVYGNVGAISRLASEEGVAVIVIDNPDRSSAKIAMHEDLMEKSRLGWQEYDRNRASRNYS